MTRRRASILPRGGQWVATVPGFGFAADDVREFEDRAKAFAWVQRRLPPKHGGSLSTGTERSYQHRDGIGAVPGWDTYPWRSARKGRYY